ncbi:nuclear transport factor 2 family protein [Pendulispora albinea]|uniref:Nuclear transport factor 2 family protein n=1 Tax=Pendulispora albinea TaxID=2741071 RepID=A0ABZ2LSP5_9BACT
MTSDDTRGKVTETTRKVVLAFYEGLMARDIEPMAMLFAEEVDWYIPGHRELAPWTGRRRGRADVVPFWRLLLSNIESVRFDLHGIFADGELAVATGEFASRMLKVDKIYESPFSAHFTVRNGQIVRYRFLEDSYGLVRVLSGHA